MTIAVIGAGLAGLSAAWRLVRLGHRVTLFERQAAPGFTAANVRVPWRGEEHRVDVPLRVFYPGYYPTLDRLYRELDVPSEPVDYAASIASGDGRLRFRYRNLRLRDRAWGMLAPQDLALGPTAWRVVRGLLHMNRDAARADVAAEAGSTSTGEWARRRGYPADFVEWFLLPAIATICTCTTSQAREFPAAVILDYAARGLASQSVRRALHGADDVQRRLVESIDDLRCGSRIASVRRLVGRGGERGGVGEGVSEGVEIRFEDAPAQRFDHVLFATPAPQARRLLVDARADEARILEAFRYTPVEVVTHRDASLMPPRRSDWSPVNLRVTRDEDAPEATIWINAVQRALRGAPPVLQTVHPHRAPREELVLGRARFERPVVDAASGAALDALAGLWAEPGRRVWFCGSYAQPGIPLLESAARSAEVAVAAMTGLRPGDQSASREGRRAASPGRTTPSIGLTAEKSA